MVFMVYSSSIHRLIIIHRTGHTHHSYSSYSSLWLWLCLCLRLSEPVPCPCCAVPLLCLLCLRRCAVWCAGLVWHVRCAAVCLFTNHPTLVSMIHLTLDSEHRQQLSVLPDMENYTDSGNSNARHRQRLSVMLDYRKCARTLFSPKVRQYLTREVCRGAREEDQRSREAEQRCFGSSGQRYLTAVHIHMTAAVNRGVWQQCI
jgi:hypothetical protein